MPDLIELLRGSDIRLQGSYGSERACSLINRAEALAETLVRENAKCAGVRMDNGFEWLCADLACMQAGIAVVPIPAFFSTAQLLHVVRKAGIDTMLGSREGLDPDFMNSGRDPVQMARMPRDRASRRVAPGIAKITFTSGTTGRPRGVCLTLGQQESVASALAVQTSGLALRKHLCVLPLAVLLENVAGVYAAMMSGMDIAVPSLAEIGLSGSCRFDPALLYRAIQKYRPDSLILLPQMLKSLVAWLRHHGKRPEGLRFVAVGGARTAAELILDARSLGMPVYEGYGLSECCSVVALNLPGADLPGSVGHPLPGREVRVTKDGEIEIRVPEGIHYLGLDRDESAWLHTGDLGKLDEAGFLHVQGRCKQVLVNSFGRNISPEWVESELLAQPGVMQAMVFGDHCPALCALIVPHPGSDAPFVEASVRRCNASLPDYARIAAYRIVEPFSLTNMQLTANGRIRRSAVMSAHRKTVDALHEEVEALFAGGNYGLLSATYPEN